MYIEKKIIKKIIFYLGFVLLFFLYFNLGFFQKILDMDSIALSGLSYDVKKKNFYEQKFSFNNEDVKEVLISFDFTYYGYHLYDNIFQTDTLSNGLRVEFSSNKHLGFVTRNQSNNLVGFTISNNIELNKVNHLKIKYMKDKIIIKLNDKIIHNNLSNMNSSFNHLAIGYGWKPERYFNGKIDNFNIKYLIDKKTYYANILFILCIILYLYLIKDLNIDDFSFFKKNKISSFILLLAVILVFTFFYKTMITFYKYKYTTSHEIELNYDIFEFLFFNEISKSWYELISSNVQKDSESNLKSFHISIKKEFLEALNQDLPNSGKSQYYKALLKISDLPEILKIKLRYRGEGNYHWLYTQKSLRIKLSNDDVYNMEKKFNLINPPYIYNFRDVANYKIAKELGLIAPDYYPVRVFINNKYMGVYMYVSQVDESLLRKNKLMPGSIYYGDSGNHPINFSGATSLWYNPNYWIKKSSRNKEQKLLRNDIDLFISGALESNTTKFYNFFNNILNKEKFINYIALDRITGTPHHDFNHNHKIYVDPYKGKIEPIEWDLREWNDSPAKDNSNYPLLEKIKLDPRLDYMIDKKVYELYSNNIVNRIINIYKKSVEVAKKDLLSDKYKDTAVYIKDLFKSNNAIWFSIPYSYNDLEQTMIKDFKILKNRKEQYIKNIIDDISLSYSYERLEKKQYKVIFTINGNTPAILDFQNLLEKDKLFVKKLFKSKMNNISPLEIIYPGRKLIESNYRVLSLSNKKVVNTAKVYEFIIDGIDESNIKSTILSIKAKNAINNKPLKLKESLNLSNEKNNLNNLLFTFSKKKTIVLKDKINIHKDIEFFEEVIIQPNTIFIMDANTSIYFYGKVTAIGTKEKPIKFIAKDPKKPWGLIAIQGKNTTGSRFEYCKFENGSLDTHNLIHYTSPFNIHDMDWFEVRHCKIGKNFVGDDSMHIAYSKGIVDSCEFHNARSDGLDVDISDVNITNNIFYKSGNDGLDIMTTKMNASNNVFIDTGDKGISVGEWSDANITDGIFIRTVIGVEIKDKSKVNANNLIFIDSTEKAINLYNKNKRYDTGGFLEADTIYLLGNKKVTADKRSAFSIKNKNYTFPKVQEFKWYKNIQNTPYQKFLKDMELKYDR